MFPKRMNFWWCFLEGHTKAATIWITHFIECASCEFLFVSNQKEVHQGTRHEVPWKGAVHQSAHQIKGDVFGYPPCAVNSAHTTSVIKFYSDIQLQIQTMPPPLLPLPMKEEAYHLHTEMTAGLSQMPSQWQPVHCPWHLNVVVAFGGRERCWGKCTTEHVHVIQVAP